MIFHAIHKRELTDLCADADCVVVDVREAFEHEAGNMGGINIPLSRFSERVGELPRDKHIVLYCRSGARSNLAAHALLSAGYERVSHVQGGIFAE